MLERVQERSWLHALGLQDRTHLRGAQKALAQWAIVDDYNNILDLSCQDTRLLRFLSQKYSLRACGIADDPEHARALRLELPDAEIFCARKEDIPWRDQAFDAVFYQMKKNAPAFDGTFLREAARVLKPGGTFCGCFYVEGAYPRTDRLIRRLYQPMKFFTPPYETVDSLEARLRKSYAQVTVGHVKSIAWFVCRKGEPG